MRHRQEVPDQRASVRNVDSKSQISFRFGRGTELGKEWQEASIRHLQMGTGEMGTEELSSILFPS